MEPQTCEKNLIIMRTVDKRMSHVGLLCLQNVIHTQGQFASFHTSDRNSHDTY